MIENSTAATLTSANRRSAASAVAVACFLGLVTWLLAVSLPGLARHPAEKLSAYWVHIVGGTVALGLAPFQFIAPIRRRFRRYHRVAGYAFAGGALAAFAGFWRMQPTVPDIFFASQATAISLWMTCAMAAVVAARRKHFLTHEHNMSRAFVLGAYFVVVRLVDRFGMGAIGPWLSHSEDVALAHSDWIAWVLPLVAVEIYYGLKWNRVLRQRE